MGYLVITEFEIAQANELTEKMLEAHKQGVMDIIRMNDGTILLTAPNEWRPVDNYQE